jgi:hypothetical protein
MAAAAAVLCLLVLRAEADLTPEQQLALQSLRPGEKATLQKAVGDLAEMPLYRAALDVDPEARRVTGTVYITYFAKDRPLEALYLRVTPNADDPSRVKLMHATVNGTPTLLEAKGPTLYKVKLDPVALPGTGATVELKLIANVPEAPEGSDTLAPDPDALNSKKADYGAFIAAPEAMSLTGLLPGVVPLNADGTPFSGPSGLGDLASYEPATYLVSVEVPRTHAVKSAGKALGEVPRPDGRVRYSFGVAAARDFPLFITKGYDVASKECDGITVESHFLAADADAGKRTLDYACSALTELQKRLGPYPYTHFRVVEARLTGGAGGMEFPGLVSVSTALYRGAADPLAALGMAGAIDSLGPLKGMLKGLDQVMEDTLEFTVAHEVAHQWFAMMVGSDPIEEPYTDEPLTQHAALLYLEWKHGKAAANAMRDAQLKMAFQFYRLSGGPDGTVERPTQAFGSTGEYAAVIYGKAPLMFDAIRMKMGDAAYFKALRQYADENRWKWTHADTLFAKLKGSEALRKHWWRETHGDQDIGAGDLAALMQGLGGGNGLPGNMQGMDLDPATMKQLEEVLKQLDGN